MRPAARGQKGREAVENRIARLGAKARAAGIHLLFATQRPSRDMVKGVIDAHFSGRVPLKVVRTIESRIILDETGVETLLGRGDLLYRYIGSPVRLQGLFATREELEGWVRWWATRRRLTAVSRCAVLGSGAPSPACASLTAIAGQQRGAHNALQMQRARGR